MCVLMCVCVCGRGGIKRVFFEYQRLRESIRERIKIDDEMKGDEWDTYGALDYSLIHHIRERCDEVR